MLEKEPAWSALLPCCREDEMQLFKKQTRLKNSKYCVLAARSQQLAATGMRELEGCRGDSPHSSFPLILLQESAALQQSCVRRAGSEAALNEVSSATGMITYPQIQLLQLLRQMVVLQNFVCRFLQWGECCYLQVVLTVFLPVCRYPHFFYTTSAQYAMNSLVEVFVVHIAFQLEM